jgi:hypothetical protein
VVHLGPFPHVTHGLARLYVEAMLPALQGFCDVVLDRSWLSEPIYAAAFRQGRTRLTAVALRMLERVAARGRTTVVRCLPPLATCLESFKARRAQEYLQREEQLTAVWHAYRAGLGTSLPIVSYDYTREIPPPERYTTPTAEMETLPHPLSVASAGYFDAPALLVGEAVGEVKEHDPLYQLPFVGFTEGGCAAWLTRQLHDACYPERELLWVNADQDLNQLAAAGVRPQVIAVLGEEAGRAVDRCRAWAGVRRATVAHPQHHKRFKFNEPYPLLAALAEVLR